MHVWVITEYSSNPKTNQSVCNGVMSVHGSEKEANLRKIKYDIEAKDWAFEYEYEIEKLKVN